MKLGRRVTRSVPAVIRLRYFVKLPFSTRVPLNKHTLAVRDSKECQVGGCSRSGTTIDHVVPTSRGGRHEWENVVLMCKSHNKAKANRLIGELGWTLKRQPKVPRGPYLVLVEANRSPSMAEQWEPYLPALG